MNGCKSSFQQELKLKNIEIKQDIELNKLLCFSIILQPMKTPIFLPTSTAALT